MHAQEKFYMHVHKNMYLHAQDTIHMDALENFYVHPHEITHVHGFKCKAVGHSEISGYESMRNVRSSL